MSETRLDSKFYILILQDQDKNQQVNSWLNFYENYMCISGRHLNETEKNLSTQEMTEIRLLQFSFSSETKPG